MESVNFKSDKLEDVDRIVFAMVEKAERTGKNTRGKICGISLKASPRSDEGAILKFFWGKMNKLKEEKKQKEREEDKKREEKQKLLFKEQKAEKSRTDTRENFFSRGFSYNY